MQKIKDLRVVPGAGTVRFCVPSINFGSTVWNASQSFCMIR